MEGTVLDKLKGKTNLGRKERGGLRIVRWKFNMDHVTSEMISFFFHLFSLFAIGLELYSHIHYELCYFYFKFSSETFKSTIYLATQFTR